MTNFSNTIEQTLFPAAEFEKAVAGLINVRKKRKLRTPLEKFYHSDSEQRAWDCKNYETCLDRNARLSFPKWKCKCSKYEQINSLEIIFGSHVDRQ